MIEIGINPIAFFSIRWYGVMVALAIVTIILWVMWQIKKGARISYDTLFMAAVIGIPSGVIVSRLLHVIDKWDYYVN
jgi:phosphatidylglycerol:prolipoprotein diacylglycerol transferase